MADNPRRIDVHHHVFPPTYKTRARNELGYAPARDFPTGFAATLKWYLDNETWWRAILDGSYRDWVATNYAAR